MPKVSITSINFNGEKFIRECLNSIRAQTFRDFEIIIIDNASSDNSAEIIEKEFPEVNLIINKKNLGYCKAQNFAITKASGKLILTLNLDLILNKDFLGEIIQVMESDEEIGSVSPKLYKLISGNKTNIFDTAGHEICKNRCAGNIGSGKKDIGQFDRPKIIFGVSGSAALHRRKMLEEIKWKNEYLDEDFISGLDDVDIDWRAKHLGWKTCYCPTAVGYHIRGGSNKNISRKWQFYNYRNRYLMMIKNDSWQNIFLDFPHVFIYEIGIFFSMLIQLQIFSIIFSIIILLPKFLKKRSHIQNRRKISHQEMRRWFQ